MQKQKKILLAQKYVFNKDLNGENFYAVPNIVGKNVMVVKHGDKTSLYMPHFIVEKNKSSINVIVDKTLRDEKITSNSVCAKINNRNCQFKDIEPIIIELSQFFVGDICYHGKLIYDDEAKRFKLYIYDILTYQEYLDKQGETPYTERRNYLNMLYKFHTFVTIDFPIAFYYGNNINECEKLSKTMESIYNNVDGYLIYKENGKYQFGQTKDVLIKFGGESI